MEKKVDKDLRIRRRASSQSLSTFSREQKRNNVKHFAAPKARFKLARGIAPGNSQNQKIALKARLKS